MLPRLLLLLTLVPAAEILLMTAVHRELANHLGAAKSLLILAGMILGTGIVGAWLARAQGLRVLTDTVRSVARGESPEGVLLDGALVVAGGAMLLAPGYLTDLLGFSFLIPGTRGFWRRVLAGWLRRRLDTAGAAFSGFRGLGEPRATDRRAGDDAPEAGPGADDVVIDVSPDGDDPGGDRHGPA